eukprot:7716811-Pyramimonas_sp.AAC.1
MWGPNRHAVKAENEKDLRKAREGLGGKGPRRDLSPKGAAERGKGTESRRGPFPLTRHLLPETLRFTHAQTLTVVVTAGTCRPMGACGP